MTISLSTALYWPYFIFNIAGPVVELEVAKQGAIFHGLQELLARPSPLLSPRGRPGSTQPQQWIQGQPPQEQHLYQNHRPGKNQSFNILFSVGLCSFWLAGAKLAKLYQ